MEFKISSSVSQIPVSSLFNDGFELSDQTIIPSEDLAGSFSPEENKVELFIYDVNNSLLDSVYDYNDWTITKNSDTSELGNTDTIQLDPSNDLIKRGYDVGDLYAVYNFVNYELVTSPADLLYISEISSDRTEIKLNSNFTSNEDLELTFEILQSKIDNADFFDEFYIASKGNNYNIGINLLLDTSSEQYSILIKLYDALPDSFSVKDEVYVATKVAETQAYEVKFFNDSNLNIDGVSYLRGPNYNLEIKDFVNNSTELKSKSELLNANSTGSNNNLQNVLNQKGVKITPNYSLSTFDEFVNFSSAKKRIENFYEKVSQIQSYENDINIIESTITGSTSGSSQVISSLASANTNIENIIKNFDGYEYYLYYTKDQSAYPKVSNSDFPYTLLNTGSTEVLQWLGSDVEGSSTYGGIILSASLYDNNNQNWLYYNIPEFVRDNQDNNNYIDFSNMVGQHFDEIWLYTKAVSEKNNTTNELDRGIPLKLSQEAIKSLGYEGFGNNLNNQNNYIGLIGEKDGSYIPPTGNESIDNYIAINNGTVINYFSPAYSFQFYVEQLGEKGFPYAIDKVSKEIYKRLYHNMAYLVKKKGTISGLRQLINIWGIPDTILRINEFGGKNKDNTDDYDYWYNRYSYAFSPISNQNAASASAVIPWMPLERNRIADNKYIVPDSFQFRFKTTGYPSSSKAGEYFSQSLAVKKSDGDETSTNFDFGIDLSYTPTASTSYSGSNDSTYKDWGVIRFYISGSSSEGGTVVSDDIYLPFYDKGWWSVMLQRDNHPSASVHNLANTNYTLYVKNKTYNGNDGNQISFEGSASLLISSGGASPSSSINESWNKFGTGSHDGIYLGGFVSGSNVGSKILSPPGKIFSGSFQEFRYYSNNIPEAVFNDFVMNPESIEGNNTTGSESSFDIVNFRAPLGNELEDKFETTISSSHTESLTSFHPASSAKSTLLITSSFVNPDGNVTSSNYHIRYYENSTTRTFSQPNTEVYFLDQPAIGVRNRISNKIEIDDGEDYGNILSSQISIDQDYQISRSYTEDITSLEVAFSPQDNVNDDIIQAFGHGVVSDVLADPRFTSESINYYPQLKKSAEDFFKKYTEGNIYDYIRLIKYVDNSLFKAIKAYVPARTSVSTGIIIKQHMLERNRYAPPSITNKSTIAVYPKNPFNTPLVFKNLELTSSLNIGEFKGEAGGVINKFNYTGSPLFGETPITQSYDNIFDTVVGLQTIKENTQKEFYDGEYSGSKVIATTQDRFNNPFKKQPEDLGFVTFIADQISLNTIEKQVSSTTNFTSTTQPGIFTVSDGGDLVKIGGKVPVNIKLTFRSTSPGGSNGYSNYNFPDGNQLLIRIRVESDIRGEILNESINKVKSSANGVFITPSLFTAFPNEKLTIFYSADNSVTQVNDTEITLRALSKWGSESLETSPPLANGSFVCRWGGDNYDSHGSSAQTRFPLQVIALNVVTGTPSNTTNLIGELITGGDFTITKPGNLKDALLKDPHDLVSSVTSSPFVDNLGTFTNIDLITQTGVGKGAKAEIQTLTSPAFPSFYYVNSIKVTSGGEDYKAGDILIIQDDTIGTPNPVAITLQSTDLTQSGTAERCFLILNEGREEVGEGAIVSFKLKVRINNTGNFQFTCDSLERGIIFSIPFSTTTSDEVVEITSPKIFIGNNESLNPGIRSESGSKRYYDLDLSIDSFEAFSPKWDNSDFNAINNNFNQNRPNSFLQVVDNSTNSGSSVLPINIDQINTNSASKANTPDSNYTMRRITIPRYEGSRIQSADYNNFTPSSTPILKLNQSLLSSIIQDSTTSTGGLYSSIPASGGSGDGLILKASIGESLKTTNNILLNNINAGTNPTNCVDGTYNNIPLTTEGLGVGGLATVVCSGTTITGITVTSTGSGYVSGDGMGIGQGSLGNLTVPYAGINLRGQTNNVSLILDEGTPPTVTGPLPVSPTRTSGSREDNVPLGTGAVFTFTANASTGEFSFLDISQTGKDYQAGDRVFFSYAALQAQFPNIQSLPPDYELQLTIPSNAIDNSDEAVFSLTSDDIENPSLNSVDITNIGEGYQVGDIITIPSTTIGGSTDIEIELKLNSFLNSSLQQFLNNDIASYNGDESYGLTAVIDTHPIYMAHFKTSKENYELWDSYTFDVDALIELPFEDITGKEKTTSIPPIIKIDGSNDNLYETSKIFDEGRKALVSYDNFKYDSIITPPLTILTPKDALLSSITQNTTDAQSVSHFSISVLGGSGKGLKVNLDVTSNAVVSIRVVDPGEGYLPGDELEVPASSIGSGSDILKILLDISDFNSLPSFTSSIDLSTLSVGSSQIYQGGLEYDLINGNEISKVSTILTQSYSTASFYTVRAGSSPRKSTNKLSLGSFTSTSFPVQNTEWWMITSSRDVINYEDAGVINLTGPFLEISQSSGRVLNSGNNNQNRTNIYGNSLAILNTINTQIERGSFFELTSPNAVASISFSLTSTTASLGFINPGGNPPYQPFDNFNPTFYTSLDVSSSLEGLYKDFNSPFIIKKGDELRVSYDISTNPNTPNLIFETFTILEVTDAYNDPNLGPYSNANDNPYIGQYSYIYDSPDVASSIPVAISDERYANSSSTSGGRFGKVIDRFDTLIVTPDPRTLPNKIKEGKIYNFTIRRRVEADDRVIVFQSPPINSKGAKTPTGPGFLLPDDLTQQQKRNALTLISQLKGTNTFEK